MPAASYLLPCDYYLQHGGMAASCLLPACLPLPPSQPASLPACMPACCLLPACLPDACMRRSDTREGPGPRRAPARGYACALYTVLLLLLLLRLLLLLPLLLLLLLLLLSRAWKR